MNGWKTKLAGAGAILGGIAIIINDIVAGSFSHVIEGWAMITGGLAVIGIGHKLDKAAA